jgi:DNA gyrase/topoisomerase IV subunit B
MQPSCKRVRKLTPKAAVSAVAATDKFEDSQTSKQLPKTRRIHWNVARTELLLEWLEENPEDRQKLFSDSSKDAKDEGRRKRVAKSTKSEYHKMIAVFVFSVDADHNIRADILANPLTYIKSVDNYLTR